MCSVIFWRNIKNTPLRWFLPYLLFIVAVELTGRYVRKVLKLSNVWMYNISVPLEYLFFVFIFWFFLKNKITRKLCVLFLLTFSMYVAVFLLINGIANFNENVLIIGSFFLIVFPVLYLVELYNSPGIISLNKYPAFWIAVGVLLFNAGEFSYDLLSKFFFDRFDRNAAVFRSINTYLNLLLYLCISFSFLWKKESVT
jgi:hypothetical protein